jgi:CHASE2 domain-containing sensor protein
VEHSGGTGISRRLPLLKAAVAAISVTLLLAWVSARTPIFDSFEYWTSDWRTAFLAERPPEQHPGIAVVVVDEDAIAGLPYRSPIDRDLMARLVQVIDGAGPRVIALDFIFDQNTEPQKDTALLEALKATNARIVVGTVDERTGIDEERRAYNARFISETRARPGLLNMRVEFDGTVRSLPAPSLDGTPFFAESAAQAAGAVNPPSGSRRIAWLRDPPNADAILRIPAGQLLGDETNALRARLLRLLKDRVVLVGADLVDSPDKFLTPLSKFDNEPIPGVLVHAQATAQLLDGRAYTEFPRDLVLAMSVLIAFAGFLLGWRYHASGILVGLPPLAVFLLLDIVLFMAFRIVLPFGLPVAAWIAGVFLGRAAYWIAERQARARAGTGVKA